MQIIVVGCGKVGRNIVTQLIKENNNVTVIDTNADLIHHISTNYDVMGIIGNGSSFNVLRQADLKHADMLIAVTESDEVNLLTCVIAKLNNSGCHTIARVRSPHYSRDHHRKGYETLRRACGCLARCNCRLWGWNGPPTA